MTERLSEIVDNVWGIAAGISIGYSFLFGFFLPELWGMLKLNKLSKYPAVNVVRIFLGWPVYLFLSVIPGLLFSQMYHQDHGGLSLLFLLIGIGVRRILHETKLWRGPPDF
jgi:ABC-type sugar transport system permease subunit